MAASSAVKRGIDAGAYRNTGTYGSPTWTEMTLVRDVQQAMPWDMGDASSRASRAKLYEKTQIDLAPQITMRADDADAAYVAMYAAAFSPTTKLDLMILDGDIATEGAMGLRAQWNINFTSQGQAAGDIVYTNFDCKPAWTSDGVPKIVIMGASSAPAFTSL